MRDGNYDYVAWCIIAFASQNLIDTNTSEPNPAIRSETDSVLSSSVTKPMRGSCLCGGVRFEVYPPFIRAGHCHCARCRKHSGTAVCTQTRVKKEQFYLRQGEELIRVYGKGEGAVKAFCVNCGSSLFGGDWPDGSEVSIRMGAFDGDPGIRPQFHTFVDDRAPWDEITDDLPQYRARFDGEHAGDFEMKQYSSRETATRETSSLQLLDDLVWQPSATAIIEPIVSRVAAQLRADLNAPLAWEPVPLHAYGGKLPSFIRSSWVFVLRGNNSASGAERHPNSHQRVMSYRGEGDLQIKIDKEWQSHFLSSDRSAAFEARWVSIPPNTWHQAVVSGEDWVVVSFHTVRDSELIEERPDKKNPDSTRQRKYLE